MIYVNEKGFDVCLEGSVIIETVEHYVKNKYVFCSPSLNSRSWDTTEKQSTCEICKPYLINSLPVIQLKLF